MISKQDGVRPRTPSELELKHNFGKKFAEIMGYASDARNAAETAKEAAERANKAFEGLDQDAIFNLLTNNGEVEGIYRAIDGQVYINASYLVTGILKSADDKTFYLDLDEGILKMEASEFSISGKTVDKIAKDEADKALDSAKEYADQYSLEKATQADIFNKLTNNGDAEGIYIVDGNIYINATYLATGVLQDKTGNIFYLDLDNGVLKMNATELSISGHTVGEIAQGKADAAEGNAKDYADGAARDAVNNQTQEYVFNKLTNNGTMEGLYMQDGDLYINASFIKSGKIVCEGLAKLPPTHDDAVYMLYSSLLDERYPPKGFFDLDGDGSFTSDDAILAEQISLGKASIEDCESITPSDVTITINPFVFDGAVKIEGTNMWGSKIEVSLGINGCTLPVVKGNLSVESSLVVGEDLLAKKLKTQPMETPKNLSWKDNGDGTYTLIGTD